MNCLDPEKFRLHSVNVNQERIRPEPLRAARGQRFLKGPIPWPWLQMAARLSSKSLHLGLALWHWSGLRKSREVRVSHKDLEGLGVTKQAARRCLRTLEKAGLIAVERKHGRSPIVRILEALPEEIPGVPLCG